MSRCSRVVWHAIIALVISSSFCVRAQAQSVGDSIVTYLTNNQNNRIGSGESADMVTEALRINQGEFCSEDLGADYPAAGDKVWGTLVTVLSIVNGKLVDSNALNLSLPGDILQFGGGAKMGSTNYPTNFTAVVQDAHGASGRPSAVFQQGLGGVRTVQKVNFNLSQFQKGWIRIYRPISRTDQTDTYKITVVNNSSQPQSLTVMYGVQTVATVTATAANTAGSFFVFKVATDGFVPCIVTNNSTYYLESTKGNEIYNSTGGSVDIRQLSQ